jgi:hypothetical protein
MQTDQSAFPQSVPVRPQVLQRSKVHLIQLHAVNVAGPLQMSGPAIRFRVEALQPLRQVV